MSPRAKTATWEPIRHPRGIERCFSYFIAIVRKGPRIPGRRHQSAAFAATELPTFNDGLPPPPPERGRLGCQTQTVVGSTRFAQQATLSRSYAAL